jgi:hypothetical protein
VGCLLLLLTVCVVCFITKANSEELELIISPINNRQKFDAKINKTNLFTTKHRYTPVGCVVESCLGTPALRVVYFFPQRATTGEDTDTDDTDTDCREEREEGG